MTTMRSALTFSAILLCIVSSSLNDAVAAKYFRPDGTKELFKLEKIPLQVDSMKELSKHLTVLAKREQDSSAIQKRSTGQLLALAMRLDPGNQEARETNRAMSQKADVKVAPEGEIIKAKARVRFFQRWLSSPDAGSDANVLAKYITDASRALKPETLNDADGADWSGVIPPLESYGGDDMLKPKQAEDPQIGEPTLPKEADPKDLSNGYEIAELSVNMPLALANKTTYRDAKDNFKEKSKLITTYTICPVKISISPDKNGIALKANKKLIEYDGGLLIALRRLQDQLRSNLTRGGAKIEIDLETSSNYSSRNGTAAATAVQLMLKASRENKQLRGDTHLCAALDAEDKLVLPPNFWSVLEALRKDDGKNGRLIVPKAAITPLTQLLVFGEPDFFVRWEVFVVETMDEALALVAKDSDPKLAEAAELYTSIRNLAGKSAVTKLAVNRAVRQRLSEITQLAPNHLSAKMLLLQGSGRRPMRLSQIGLAYHLQPVVKHMSYTLIRKVNPDKPDASALKKLHVEARAELDPIERLVSRSAGDYYEDVLDVANDLRSLNLLIKRHARDGSGKNKIKDMIVTLQKDITELEAKINQAIAKAAQQ